MEEKTDSMMTRRKMILGGAAFVAATAATKFNLADAQRTHPEWQILGPDGETFIDLRRDPNVTFDDQDRIKTFYGIERKDVEDLPGHPRIHSHHMGPRDPYEGYKNKVNVSCCNRHDCGPAIAKQIGERIMKDPNDPEKEIKEGIYAFGMKLNGRPRFAITVPHTRIYQDENIQSTYPEHGCILNLEPLCLFIKTGI